MGRRIISLFALLALVLLLESTTSAHSNLIHSQPAAGAVLQTSPRELVLDFSENLDASFSKVQLLNSTNQVINSGPGVIDPAQPRTLRLELSTLPKDSYTASWRVRSSEDGHISEGSVPFGIGVATSAAALIPTPGAPDPATETPPPLDSLGRWLNLLAAVVAFGALPFGLFVWRPAVWTMAKEDGDRRAADMALLLSLRQLVIWGCAAFVLSNLLFLLIQAADAASVSLLGAVGAPVVQLLTGRSGMLWLARIALTLAIAALTWRLPPIGTGSATRWWLALLCAGGVLLTFSLQAHSAALGADAPLAVAADWLHIAASVVWLGGLLPLMLALRLARRLPAETPTLRSLVPRFSHVALACVIVLTLTGVYSYLLHIGRLDLLPATSYGRALLVKLGLFGFLLLLAALNLLVLSPHIRAGGKRFAGILRRSVGAELVLGIFVLLVVGAMTSVAPSAAAWDAHERLGGVQTASIGDVNLVLHVAPMQIGDNVFAVDVQDKRAGAQGAQAKVLLRFDMAGMDMGVLQTETQTTNNQRYVAQGSFTPMGGRWSIEVVLRRAGFDDVRHTFQFDIVRSSQSGSELLRSAGA